MRRTLIGLCCIATLSLTTLASSAEREEETYVICRRALMPGTLDVRNDQGLTPLHQAILEGRLTQVTELIQKGADIGATTPTSRTALDLALASQKPGMLLAFFHGVFEHRDEVMSTLPETIQRETDLGYPPHVLLQKLPSELTKVYGHSLLAYLVRSWSVQAGHTLRELREIITYLQIKTDERFLYETDINGDGELFHAVRDGKLDRTEFLLSMGADPTFAGPQGNGTAAISVAYEMYKKSYIEFAQSQQIVGTPHAHLIQQAAEKNLREQIWNLLARATQRKDLPPVPHSVVH